MPASNIIGRTIFSRPNSAQRRFDLTTALTHAAHRIRPTTHPMPGAKARSSDSDQPTARNARRRQTDPGRWNNAGQSPHPRPYALRVATGQHALSYQDRTYRKLSLPVRWPPAAGCPDRVLKHLSFCSARLAMAGHVLHIGLCRKKLRPNSIRQASQPRQLPSEQPLANRRTHSHLRQQSGLTRPPMKSKWL